MPVEVVQMATGAATGGESVSATFAAAPTEDNFLVAAGSSPTLVGGINTGNGWTLILGTGGPPGVKFWAKWAGASESVTHTLGQAGQVGDRRMTLFELSGVDGANPFHDSGPTSGTGVTSLLSDVLFTIHNDSPVFVCMQTATATPSFANTWTNGFVQQSVVGSNHTVGARFDTAISSYTTTESWTTSSNVQSYGISLNPADPLRLDLVHTSANESFASTSVTLNGGDGAGLSVTAGDLRVVFFATKDGTYPELNTPSGWTGIESVGDTGPAIRAMYHVAGTGETTGLTLTSTTARDLMASQRVFTKANQESPIGQFSSTSVTSATQLTSSAVTLEEAAAAVIVFVAHAGTVSNRAWTDGFVAGPGVESTSIGIKNVSAIDSYDTTVSWTTARTSRAIALVVKQELTPLVAGDGWGISS